MKIVVKIYENILILSLTRLSLSLSLTRLFLSPSLSLSLSDQVYWSNTLQSYPYLYIVLFIST